MVQQGFVMEIIDNNTAKIKMTRHSACVSCGKCATTSDAKDIIVEVDNKIGAQIGDKVNVNMESINVLKAAMIVYLTPLISLLVGMIGSHYILEYTDAPVDIEIISAVCGFIAMSIAFIVLKIKDPKFRESREYIPTITAVMQKE